MSTHQTPSSLNSSNPKGTLQEYAQKRNLDIPTYSIVNESGADHLKAFTVEVSISGEICGIGTSKSKKEAEKNAAIDALSHLK